MEFTVFFPNERDQYTSNFSIKQTTGNNELYSQAQYWLHLVVEEQKTGNFEIRLFYNNAISHIYWNNHCSLEILMKDTRNILLYWSHVTEQFVLVSLPEEIFYESTFWFEVLQLYLTRIVIFFHEVINYSLEIWITHYSLRNYMHMGPSDQMYK